MSDPSIRTASVGDAGRLTSVYHSAYAQNRALGFPAKAESVERATVEEWIRSDTVLVATEAETIVGGVRLEGTTAGRVKLSRLAVHEDWKENGIGSRLLDRAEAWARESGHEEVWLTTPEEHPLLLDLYRGRGYAKRGGYPLEYRDYDELRLAKRID